MAIDGAKLTIVLNDPDAEFYARMISDRFPEVRAIIAPDSERIERYIGEADALLASPRFPMKLLDKAVNLKWLQCTGAGVEWLFPTWDKLRHITVTNARGIHGDIISDFVMAGVTMLHWDFRRLMREQAEKQWNSSRYVVPLADRTLGVVGLGSIGATIARRAKSAGMTVIGTKWDISVPVEGVDRLFAPDAICDLLPLCDFVVLALPATPNTIGLLGADEIARMKPSAFLINIARGNIVVEAELIKALQTGTIAGAMLDVFEREPLLRESPFWDMPNVIITPHISGGTPNYAERLFSIFGDNIGRFLKKQPLKNVVDIARRY